MFSSRHQARVTELCLNQQRVYCDSCRDACDADAIKVRPQLGGVYETTIDDEDCTACGMCVAVCPASAIRIEVTI